MSQMTFCCGIQLVFEWEETDQTVVILLRYLEDGHNPEILRSAFHMHCSRVDLLMCTRRRITRGLNKHILKEITLIGMKTHELFRADLSKC